ncbi:MAG: IS110 family transposase [Magnetococcus sp. XQGC-1]
MDKEIKVLGIDLAKQSFQVHGVNGKGQVVVRKTLSREKLLEYMAQLPPCLVGMEACGGAHDFARKFRQYGHTVRLMAPQFVKPYVKSNKNDRADAEAICEAVQRPNMRFVPIKSVDQQDLQSLHRVRSMVIAHRTALINQIRGLLIEYGIVIPKGANQVRSHLPDILADITNGLTTEMRALLTGLSSELLRRKIFCACSHPERPACHACKCPLHLFWQYQCLFGCGIGCFWKTRLAAHLVSSSHSFLATYWLVQS